MTLQGLPSCPAVPRQVLLLLIKLLDMEWWEVLGVGEEKLSDNMESVVLDLVAKRILKGAMLT